MNALTTQSEGKALPVRQQLARMAGEFKKALPGHIPVERFVRTVQTAVQMNPQIHKVASTAGGMPSLLAACTKAATDGLILDGREAALATFRTKVTDENGRERWEDRIQYIPMVAGLMKKARNSGQIASLAAHVVYENDEFHYILGDDERIQHAPRLNGERGKPIAVYAIVRMTDGSVQREVMDRAAVMRIAGQSKNARQYQPDSANFAEWWRKTVIRRISKYLPSSSDRDAFQRAVERIDEDFDFDADPSTGEAEAMPKTAGKTRGAAAALLQDVTPSPASAPEPDAGTKAVEGEVIDPQTGEILGEAAPQPGDAF